MATKKTEYTGRYKEFINEMPDSKAKIYLTSRVVPQMDYYRKKSAINQKRFRWFSVLSIICNGIIPVFVILGNKLNISSWAEIIITILSATAGILTAIASLMTYRELWLKYRLTLEHLKSTLDQYFIGTGEFYDIRNDEDARTNLLEKLCSAAMSDEHNAWKQLLSIEKSEK